MAIPQAFVWGEGGARMTPEQIAQRRALARGLLKSDYSPVGSWAEGLARASGSWLGALQERQAGQAESANLAEDASARASLISALSGVDAADPSIAPSAPAPEFAYDPSVYGAAGAEGGAGAIREGLIARGLPEHVADGFIMNFQDESGLNPGINEVNPLVPGSRGGFGLAQWTGPRRVALEEFAAARGVDVSDPNVQLDFLMSELQGPESRAAQSIMAAPDAGSAAAAIARDFLRPAPEHLERRVAQYGGGQQRAPGNIVAQALSAAGSPYASDATRSIANLIVQQQMQQNDPMRQLQMENMRSQIDERAATRKQWQKLDDGTLFNPMTGETRTVGSQMNPLAKNLSKGEEAVDKKFADEYVQWSATGGFADIEKQISQLEEAAAALEAGNGLTGPLVGSLPDFITASVAPDVIATREAVEEVAQRNLRAILGPQFTEKEGDRLIARTYNPRLSEAENAKRVRRLIAQIKTAAQVKQDAANYYEQNGTLKGWKGKMPSLSDFDPEQDTELNAAPAAEGWQELGGVKIRKKQ